MSNSESAFWNDASENQDEVISTKLNKGVIDILGYKCDELILTCKSGIQKYYFTSKLPLDSKAFEKHKYGNWYAFLSTANAVPLKIIIDNAQFTMQSEVTEVKPGKLEQSLFQLPANIQTVKSPY
ncbi:MAG: DUF4412 domain-containing protein [Sphingobacteriales bacterium]|nr:MAG: DUF4412 domain-containing protein [Sphingobacteriales bacterium]